MIKKKTEPVAKDGIIFIRNISSKLKKRFKVACAAKGVTMTDAILDFMRKTAKEGEHETN